MDKLQPNISGIIQGLRKNKGLTQNELADILHISRTCYSHYETGRRLPEASVLLKLSSYYEINIMLMLFVLSFDIAEAEKISSADIIKSFSYGLFYDTKIFDGFAGYLTLPEKYKNDILTFINCAISVNNRQL